MQLYRGPIKIFSNWSTSLEGGLALTEDKLKEQVALLELGTIFVLCGNLALHHPHPQQLCSPARTTGWRRSLGNL